MGIPRCSSGMMRIRSYHFPWGRVLTSPKGQKVKVDENELDVD